MLPLPEDYTLLEADIENLYPSINTQYGLKCLRTFLLQFSEWPHDDIEYVVRLTEWVLNNNFLTFNNTTYRQDTGTAMGTPLAVTYSNICVRIHETTILQIMFNNNIPPPIKLFRYIDDLFGIMLNHEHAKILLELLNSTSTFFKYTYKINNETVNFLNLTIIKTFNNNLTELITTHYTKPINKFFYIPAFSHHQPHIFKNWITNYIQHLRLIRHLDTDYHIEKIKFHHNRLNRGYSDKFLQPIFNKIYNRQEIMQRFSKNNNSQQSYEIQQPPINFRIHYNTRTKILQYRIRKNLKYTSELKRDLIQYLQINDSNRNHPMITHFTNANLGKQLTKSNLLKHALYKNKNNHKILSIQTN